jgi:hypothetical protein
MEITGRLVIKQIFNLSAGTNGWYNSHAHVCIKVMRKDKFPVFQLILWRTGYLKQELFPTLPKTDLLLFEPTLQGCPRFLPWEPWGVFYFGFSQK